MKKPKQKTAKQLAKIRLVSKRPQTFTDRKKQANKKACRRRIKV